MASCVLRSPLKLLGLWLLAWLWVVFPQGLLAHNLPGSALQLDFYRDGVAAELTVALPELEQAFKEPLAANPTEALARHGEALKAYILDHIDPESLDKGPWEVQWRGMQAQLEQRPVEVVVRLWLKPPPGASPRRFILNFSLIHDELLGYSTFVLARNDWETGTFSSQPEPLGVFSPMRSSLQIDRSRGSWWQGFRSVCALGVHHIADGTDHLLFLLVLLLPAPLAVAGRKWGPFRGTRRSLAQLLKIVTAFTVGHSLTLAIGAAGWVRLHGPIVEVLIAISILVSALHAIRPWFAGREMFIAGGFGLIHGLAFASSLAEFSFSHWYLAWTILGFNLGIEAMQLVVVVALMPWLLLLSRTPYYTLVRLVGAGFGGVAALGWVGQRAFGLANPVEPLVNGVVAHPLWLAGALAGAALIATGLRKPTVVAGLGDC